jgi:hypothetical protein
MHWAVEEQLLVRAAPVASMTFTAASGIAAIAVVQRRIAAGV